MVFARASSSRNSAPVAPATATSAVPDPPNSLMTRETLTPPPPGSNRGISQCNFLPGTSSAQMS
jgi:hypothetical protein